MLFLSKTACIDAWWGGAKMPILLWSVAAQASAAARRIIYADPPMEMTSTSGPREAAIASAGRTHARRPRNLPAKPSQDEPVRSIEDQSHHFNRVGFMLGLS